MKLMKWLMVGVCLSSTLLLAEEGSEKNEGEEVLSAYTNASWVLPHWRKFYATDEFLGLKGWTDIHTKRSFEVDPEAEYEISGMFRTKESQENPTRLEFGFDPIDENNNVIAPTAIGFVPETQTKLAKDAKIGDKTVDIVKKGKWLFGVIAFNAKEDFSDLPNREIYEFTSPKNKPADGEVLTLTLKKPLKNSYKAGTLVRNHINKRLWTVSRFYKVPKEWTLFSAKIKGLSVNGRNNKQWWPGTARARVFLLVSQNSFLEFKDVRVVKISE